MILTKEQVAQFEEAAKPLIKFLCENFNPHTTVIVTPTGAEVLSGSASVQVTEFVKD